MVYSSIKGAVFSAREKTQRLLPPRYSVENTRNKKKEANTSFNSIDYLLLLNINQSFLNILAISRMIPPPQRRTAPPITICPTVTVVFQIFFIIRSPFSGAFASIICSEFLAKKKRAYDFS